VYSNNWSGWPYSPSDALGQFGSYKWQCVELIERFVNLAGFYHGIIPAPGNAQSMFGAADSRYFEKFRNGGGYRPVPGDIVVYKGHSFGHVAIVESENRRKGTVGVLEQNVLDEDGRGVNVFHGKTLYPNPSWTGFSVIGFLHAKANVSSAAGPSIAVGVCGARGEGAPPSPGGICTVRPDGSDLEQITKRSSDSEPAWSPDRKKLAFVRQDKQGNYDIYIVNSDRTGLRQLTHGINDQEPAWSPSGKQIAFSRNGRIALLNLGNGSVTLVTAGPLDSDPAWSANGSLIAFSSGTAPAEIDVMTATGANDHTLVTSAIQPAWAPSGNDLAFTRFTNSGGQHIAVINSVTGGPVRLLTTGPSDNSYSAAWSPNGKQIAFGRGADRENPGVWVMNSNGSNQTRVLGGYEPAW
jgi:hypothetical protein